MNKGNLQDYWKNPPIEDKGNQPEAYLMDELTEPRTKLLLKYFKKLKIPKDARILELGCNVGRNLNALYNEGYTNLTGVEISDNALKVFVKNNRKMMGNCFIYHCSIEEFLKMKTDILRWDNETRKYDVIFTMAVLQHIPPKSEWIFKKISDITNKYLITIEDEVWKSHRHFPRNYKKIFCQWMPQIKSKNCWFIKELGRNFKLRVFENLRF